MAEAAMALGKGQSIVFQGQTYTLAPFNNDMQAMFEMWLEHQAWSRVERTRGRVPEDVYQDRHDAVTKLVTSGEFAFGSALAARAAQTMQGQKYILFLMLCAGGNGEVSERLASEMMDQVYQEISARMKAANFDPNSPTPTTESAGPSA